MKVVFLGLSITSSWGNGHATNYRALVRELDARGHDVLFLERDAPWYEAQRDLARPPWGRTCLYRSLDELRDRFGGKVREADLVVVGSYVPEGVAVGRWATETASGMTAFYDIDTPVTLAKLARGDFEYLAPELVGAYDLYLSFTGGPTLERLEQEFGARRACAFHCLVDPDAYRPAPAHLSWELGYLGTYSEDRQPQVDALLVEPARARPDARFVVAGPQYPTRLEWPANVERLDHVPPAEHRAFYAAQRWTLNVTRADMRAAGWSPSVRLFEAAACGVPVISDRWPGLDELFREGEEIVIADSPADVLRALREIPDDERQAIGERARTKVLAEHTAARRVEQLEALVGVTA
jgi:spore maturation protein CgeB